MVARVLSVGESCCALLCDVSQQHEQTSTPVGDSLACGASAPTEGREGGFNSSTSTLWEGARATLARMMVASRSDGTRS